MAVPHGLPVESPLRMRDIEPASNGSQLVCGHVHEGQPSMVLPRANRQRLREVDEGWSEIASRCDHPSPDGQLGHYREPHRLV
jgi:hypothetical protein